MAAPAKFTRYMGRTPQLVLARKMVCRGNKADTKVLIQWVEFNEDNATWEFLNDLKRKYPNVKLEDNVVA